MFLPRRSAARPLRNTIHDDDWLRAQPISWPMIGRAAMLDVHASSDAPLSATSMALYGIVSLCVVLSTVFVVVVCSCSKNSKNNEKNPNPARSEQSSSKPIPSKTEDTVTQKETNAGVVVPSTEGDDEYEYVEEYVEEKIPEGTVNTEDWTGKEADEQLSENAELLDKTKIIVAPTRKKGKAPKKNINTVAADAYGTMASTCPNALKATMVRRKVKRKKGKAGALTPPNAFCTAANTPANAILASARRKNFKTKKKTVAVTAEGYESLAEVPSPGKVVRKASPPVLQPNQYEDLGPQNAGRIPGGQVAPVGADAYGTMAETPKNALNATRRPQGPAAAVNRTPVDQGAYGTMAATPLNALNASQRPAKKGLAGKAPVAANAYGTMVNIGQKMTPSLRGKARK